MKCKYSFRDPECMFCPHFVTYGNLITENRFCNNFKHGKEKRFLSSDPKYKAPDWCPRRIVPVMRVYRPVEGRPAEREREKRVAFEENGGPYLSVSSYNYTQVYETPAMMTAKQFYQKFAVDQGDLWFEIGEFLETGDIIEIDNGLIAHQFCLVAYSTIAVVSSFDRKEIEKVKRSCFYETV